ncbi:MAG TPA: hypothetical protein V6D21_12120 [Candidatus Obscuribacterales bacterium]
MTLSTEAQINLNSILTALDGQMQLSENAAYQAALKYYTVLSCLGSSGGGGGSIDISTLATEATAMAINGKLPNLSSGRIPVSLLSTNLTADWQDLTTDTVIAAGSCYVYLEVILGPVTINGLSFSTGKFLNLESSPFARHPEINLVISAGKSVRLIRGY